MNSALDLLSFAALSHSLNPETPVFVVESIEPEPVRVPSPIPPISEFPTLPIQEDDGDQTEDEDIEMGRVVIPPVHVEENSLRRMDQLPSLPAFATFLPTNDSLKLIISAAELPSLPPALPTLSTLPTLPPLPVSVPHRVPEDAGIIRCVCSITSDDGFTIQCDGCNAWLHASCVSILPEEVPEVYLCGICDPEAARLRGVNSQRAEEEQRKRLEEDSKDPESEGMGRIGSIGIGKRVKPRSNSMVEEPLTSPVATSSLEDLIAPSAVSLPPTILRDSIGRKRRVGKQPGTPSYTGPGRPRTTSLINGNGDDVNSPRLSSLGALRGNQVPAPVSDDDESGDERFENWQYEFTPIDSNLWSNEKLIPKLKEILFDLSSTEETTTKTLLKELFDKQTFAAFDPNPVVLNSLPNIIPTIVKPLANLPFHLVPPVAASYIPSNASSNPQCPYPRPTAYGLFSTSTISSGSFIQIVSGKVSSIEAYRAEPLNQYSLIGVPKAAVRAIGLPFSLIIDSRKFGNETRFIRNGCHPNVMIKLIHLPEVETEETKENWNQQKRRNGKEIVFGLFAITEIGKKDELILPWDWDDDHIVHSISTLMNSEMLSKMKNLEMMAKKMFLVSTAILSTTSCGCERKKDCNIFWMCRVAGTSLSSNNGKKDTILNLISNSLNSDDKGGRGGGKKKVSSRKSDLGPLIGLERNWISKFIPVEVVEEEEEEVIEEVMEEVMEIEEIPEVEMEMEMEIEEEKVLVEEVEEKPVEISEDLKNLFSDEIELDKPAPLTKENLATQETESAKKKVTKPVPPVIEDGDSDSSDLTEPLPNQSEEESSPPKKRKLSINSSEDEIVRPPRRKILTNNKKSGNKSPVLVTKKKEVNKLEEIKKSKKSKVKIKTVTRELDPSELLQKEREKLKLQKSQKPNLEPRKKSTTNTSKSTPKSTLQPASILLKPELVQDIKPENTLILSEVPPPPFIFPPVNSMPPIQFAPLVLSSVPPPPFIATEPSPIVEAIPLPEPEPERVLPPPPVEVIAPPPPRARMSLAAYRQRQAQQKPADVAETSVVPAVVAPVAVSDTPPIPAFIPLPIVDSPTAMVETQLAGSVPAITPQLDAAAVLKSIGDYFAREQSNSNPSTLPVSVPIIAPSEPARPRPVHSYSESVAETVGRMNEAAAEEGNARISRFSAPLREAGASIGTGLGLDTGLPSPRVNSYSSPREPTFTRPKAVIPVPPLITTASSVIANAYANVGTPQRNSSTPSPIMRPFGLAAQELPKGPRSGPGSPPNRYSRTPLPPAPLLVSNLPTVRQTAFPDRQVNVSRTFNSPTTTSTPTSASYVKVLPSGPRGFTSSSNSTPLPLPSPTLPPPSPIINTSNLGNLRSGWNHKASGGGWGTASRGGRFDPVAATIPIVTHLPARELLPIRDRDTYDGVPRGPASMSSGGGFSSQVPTSFVPSTFSPSTFQIRGAGERGRGRGRGRGSGWNGRGRGG